MRRFLAFVFLILPSAALSAAPSDAAPLARLRRAGSLSAFLQESAPPITVQYNVNTRRVKEGRVPIEMTVQNAPDDVEVAIPAWRPGSYRLLNYHQRIRDVSAEAGGEALAVEAVDRQTWKVKGGGRRDLTIRYLLQPDPGQLDGEHYFIEGPGTYLYVVGHKEAACTAKFELPDGWRVATGLRFMCAATYAAPDYDTFVDCPTELGKFELHSFAQKGVIYEIAAHAAGPWDAQRLVEAIKKIVAEQVGMFGAAPFDRYVFIFHFPDTPTGGGLEHLNSTDISMPYAAVRDDGRTVAGISSHEFFHMINVKRLRPKELGPFDYTGPVRSKALWFCEGVTSYYGDLTMVRTGIWTEERHFRQLEDAVETLQEQPLRKTLSVEESSRTVWDRKSGEPYLDYYNKGELIGWLLDMKIRTLTENRKSLDDVMRHMYRTYVVEPSKNGQGPIGVGFPEDGILKAVNEIAGQDFTEFFRRCASGTEELPYGEILPAAGLSLEVSLKGTADLASALSGPSVKAVPAGSDDEKAGLKAGDYIRELAGRKVTRATFRAELEKLRPGEPVAVKVLRDGRDVELKLTPIARERIVAALSRSPDASPEQTKLLDSWLGRR